MQIRIFLTYLVHRGVYRDLAPFPVGLKTDHPSDGLEQKPKTVTLVINEQETL